MKKLSAFLVSLICLSSVFFVNKVDDVSIDQEINNNNETESKSTGATGGYLVNKPFDLSVRQSSYISSTGYLYAAGYNNKYEFGNGNKNVVTTHFRLYKEGNEADVFKDPLSWGFSWYHTIIVDNDGSVWTAGTNNEYRLGLGLTSTSAIQSSFVQVETIGTTDYKAVSTSPGYFHSVVLLEDDTLWASGSGKYFGKSGSYSSYTEIELPDVDAKILDYSGSYTSTYVLYDNGELYRVSGTTTNWVLVGEDIKFFDADGSADHIYAVTNNNEILFKKENSNDKLVQVKDTIIGEVVQVRGAGISTGSTWGYLNKAGDLYIADEQSDGQGDLTRIDETNIRFFDMGSSYDKNVTTYGYVNQYAQMYLWGSNTEGQLATGSTSSGLDDPNHSESSLVIPSLDADFTGLYSVAPIIRKSSDNSIIDPNSLYLNFNEGSIYVDYSNYEFHDSINQKIEVSITDTYGVICSFNLDKNNNVNKTASYPSAPGVYTITSQLFSFINNEWVLSGSPNCTIFELGIPESTMQVDEEIFTKEMELVAYNSSLSVDMYSNIINQAYIVFEKGITFTNDFYYYDDGMIKQYNVTKDDISVRLLRKTSSATAYTNITSVTSFSSSYNYYIEFTFKGIDGFYEEQVQILQLNIVTRDIYSGSNTRLTNEGGTNESTSLTFYNGGTRYYVSLLSADKFLNDNYKIEIEITGTNFYSKYFYGDENTWLYMPKEAGSYTIKVYLYEDTGYGIIEYPSYSSRSITISKGTAIKISIEDTKEVEEVLSNIIAPSAGDASNDIKKAFSPFVSSIVLGSSAYGVYNNEFSNLVLTTDELSFAFYYDNNLTSTVNKAGDYIVRVYLNSSNYSYSSSNGYYISFNFTLEGSTTLEDDLIVFDNNTTEIFYYSGTKYSIDFIHLDDVFKTDDYTIKINITDEFGFNSTYDYKTTSNTWDYMPKMVGEYTVNVILTDKTGYTSISKTTLYISDDSDVSLNVSENLTDIFGTILTKDEQNLIDDLNSLISNSYLSVTTNLYKTSRVNGLDIIDENVVVTTLSDYSFVYYNSSNEIVNIINSEDTYYLVIIFKGMTSSYVDLECSDTFSVNVEKRITLNNIEVSNKVGATAYFIDSDGRMVSVVNYNSKYSFIIDAIRDNNSYFDDSYTVKVRMYNDDNQYEFTYINPVNGTIDFSVLPKLAGTYNVEMSLYNSFDDYVSIRTTQLKVNYQDIKLILNEGDDLELIANKNGLNDTLDDYYLNLIDLELYAQIIDKITVVENNELIEKEIKDVIKLTYFILEDDNYIEVDEIKSNGTYKVSISIKNEYDSFSYDVITDEFIVQKDMSFVVPVVITSIAILAILGVVIVVIKRKK